MSHTAIDIPSIKHKMQLNPSQKTPFKAITALFKASEKTYFEKWQEAQDEIAQLKREIYALKHRPPFRVRFNNGARPTVIVDEASYTSLDSPV